MVQDDLKIQVFSNTDTNSVGKRGSMQEVVIFKITAGRLKT